MHFKNSTLAHNELLWGKDLRYCCYTQLAFRAKTSWCFDFQALWSPFLVGFFFLKICHNCNSQAHKTDTCVCTYTCFCTQMGHKGLKYGDHELRVPPMWTMNTSVHRTASVFRTHLCNHMWTFLDSLIVILIARLPSGIKHVSGVGLVKSFRSSTQSHWIVCCAFLSCDPLLQTSPLSWAQQVGKCELSTHTEKCQTHKLVRMTIFIRSHRVL